MTQTKRKKRVVTATEISLRQDEEHRQQLMKLFGDTANLFGEIVRDGVITHFGETEVTYIARIPKERFEKMERLYKAYHAKGLL